MKFANTLTVVAHVIRGVLGLLANQELSSRQKVLLFTDYVRLFFQRKSPFTIGAFGLKVYYPSYGAFVYLFNEIFCAGVYPSTALRISGLPAKEPETYIDCGANIGLSVLWYKIFNPRVNVLAFEPDTESAKYLRKNLRVNKIGGIRIEQMALSNKNGKQKFYKIEDPVQNLDSSLTLNQDLPHHTFMVKTVKLSRFLNKKVSLLKMDVEGGEYDVIEDLITTQKIKLVEKMILEAHYFDKKDRGKLRNMVQVLKKYGRVRMGESNRNSRVIYFNL